MSLLTSQDSFVVRSFNPSSNPMPLINEIPLKLARKCLQVFGESLLTADGSLTNISKDSDEKNFFFVVSHQFRFGAFDTVS